MFELIIWSVEHGSAAHLYTPDGQVIVFDAGRSDSFSPAAHLKSMSLAHGVGASIDRLIISHPHQDHIADLPAYAAHCKPRVFVRNRTIEPSLIYPSAGVQGASLALQWYHYFDTTWTAPVSPALGTYPWQAEYGGVALDVFHNSPSEFRALGVEPSLNELSLLACVRYGGLSVILPGDSEPLGQLLLLGKAGVREALGAGTTRILVAPHHGRRSGIAIGDTVYRHLVDAVRPHLVILSDVWGCEHSCPELYEPVASGYFVWSLSDPNRSSVRRVVTTKTNDSITIRQTGSGSPLVYVP